MSVGFLVGENINKLEIIIRELCNTLGCDFDLLKIGKRICKDRNGAYWTEEHAACIIGALNCLLPIENRIQWIASFIGRTEIQVESILAIHFNELFGKGKEDGYLELFILYEQPIAKFFLRFYKINYHYVYRDAPYRYRPQVNAEERLP